MIKTMFAFAALALAVPALAQTDAAAPPPAGAALPKCSATVRDSCDQSMTTEKYALSADAAMKTGGVGDRASDNVAKRAIPMTHHKMTHKHMMMHHKMMKDSAMAPADAAAPATPQ